MEPGAARDVGAVEDEVVELDGEIVFPGGELEAPGFQSSPFVVAIDAEDADIEVVDRC